MLNMIKNKNNSNSTMKITTVFGYSLFALTILSFLLTTAIPFGLHLQSPTARHSNIVVMILVFGIAAILPALVSYVIGDKATHVKNKSLHHYNGVLFGIEAYWVAFLFSWVGFSSVFNVGDYPYPTPLIVTNIMPVIFTIILMAVVAVNFAKQQRNKASVLHYRPFQVVLIASIVIGFVYPYVSGLFAANSAVVIVALSIPLVAMAIAYKVLAKHNETLSSRLCDAFVAMSMGWVTVWLASSFISFLRLPYQVEAIVSYVIGSAVFVAYLYLRAHKS